MKRRVLCWILGAEAALLLAGFFCRGMFPGVSVSALTYPFSLAAQGLRQLSLSGGAGNVLAIALYLLISCLPLTFLFRRKLHWEDGLLGLLTVLLLFGLYGMINPGMLSRRMVIPVDGEYESALLSVLIWSVLAAYGVLRLIRRISGADRRGLYQILAGLLCLLAVVLVYLIFGSGLNQLGRSLAFLENQGGVSQAQRAVSCGFIAVQFLVDMVPYGADLWVLFLLLSLLQLLGEDPGSAQLLTAGRRISRVCMLSLVIVTLSQVFFNLAQVAFLPSLLHVRVEVQLPLLSLLFLLAVLLLVQFLLENKELQDDNDLFI